MVIQQIKMVLLTIVGIFRRALCCFSRRRKLSHTDHQLSVVSVVVDRNVSGTQGAAHAERDWNSWDDSPRTVEEHIEQYRQKIASPPEPTDQEPEQDFFSELTPDIKPQMKYYMGSDDPATEKNNFSRLEAKTDVPIAINADLEDWEEENDGGWEELDSEQTKQMIREKRRELRSNRQNTAKTTTNTNGIGATRLSGNQQRLYSNVT